MDAVEYLLDDKKLIKYIHGPPGTGKSYLALWFASIAVMFDPPAMDADDEWDLPLDLGPELKPEDFDKVDMTKPPRAVQLTMIRRLRLHQFPTGPKSSDESVRDKEITFLTLIANFSPRAYFRFGDHLYLVPTGFSKHQHRGYKPPRSFKAATADETSAVVLTSSDKPGQDEASKAAATKTEIADFAAAQKDWDKPREATNKAEQKETETEDAKQKQEEVLPNPSTVAKQLGTSVIHRLMEAGHPIYADSELAAMDKAAVNWLQGVSGKDDIDGNTLIANMNSFESCEARSLYTVGNVNFALHKVVELLADPKFSRSTKAQRPKS
ncbi:hypothetical protein FJTKL_10449 [Diaporthe vaccinii]|uniref:Uncharacterized protein n=1 Tax=Diaporthe vaccinii TaxID=105482 RepID=A0ABR4EJH7_9PEZI